MLALVLALGVLAASEGQPSAPSPDLTIEAWLSTAGPYGESWSYTLVPSGSLSLHVYYSLDPSGSLMAEFQLSDEQLARLRQVVTAERFFELPEDIAADMVMLHRPDYRLTITLGDRKAKVSLYDPSQMKADARAARFLRVWRQMYEGLPLKPNEAAEQ